MISPNEPTSRIFVRSLGFVASILLATAAPVLAQEATPNLADTPTGVVFRWIIFGIVVGAVSYALAKAAPGFRKHSEEISQRIAEGARAREAAEKQRNEAKAKLAGIQTDVAELRAEAKRSATAEAERLRELAKVEAAAIERAAQAEVAAAERVARMELKRVAARMAIDRAEALLQKELTPQAEAALFRTFVAQLEESSN
jgi:F0F1-type ATP synthase membrane subunit b/b'